MRLSIVIPLYNEANTITRLIEKIKSVSLDFLGLEKEIIIVDDCSNDESREILSTFGSDIRIFMHDKNLGKSSAIRTGLRNITGDLVIIQDADLEYYPADYPKLILPILEGRADIVYGSRFLRKNSFCSLLQVAGNIFLTKLTNILYRVHLTDLETCYKVFKSSIFNEIEIVSEKFEFEPEVTAKVIKKGYKIVEVPIRYNARDVKKGKKIHWRDGFGAVKCLIKNRFS